MLKFPIGFAEWLNAMQLTLAIKPVLDAIENEKLHDYLHTFYAHFGKE